MSLTARRIGAYLVDVISLAVVLVPLAALLALAVGVEGLSGFEVWLRSLTFISIPTWTYFVVTEHRRGRGIGKGLLGIATRDRSSGEPPGWGAALVRTAVTLAPWELTHLAFFGLAPEPGQFEGIQVAVATVADLLIVAYVAATLLAGGRRSPADMLAGTEVVRVG